MDQILREEVRRQIGRQSQLLAKAEVRVKDLRASRDALLHYMHATGDSVVSLASLAGVSRQSVYSAIGRGSNGES